MFSPLISEKVRSTARRSAPWKSRLTGLPVNRVGARVPAPGCSGAGGAGGTWNAGGCGGGWTTGACCISAMASDGWSDSGPAMATRAIGVFTSSAKRLRTGVATALPTSAPAVRRSGRLATPAGGSVASMASEFVAWTRPPIARDRPADASAWGAGADTLASAPPRMIGPSRARLLTRRLTIVTAACPRTCAIAYEFPAA